LARGGVERETDARRAERECDRGEQGSDDAAEIELRRRQRDRREDFVAFDEIR